MIRKTVRVLLIAAALALASFLVLLEADKAARREAMGPRCSTAAGVCF